MFSVKQEVAVKMWSFLLPDIITQGTDGTLESTRVN